MRLRLAAEAVFPSGPEVFHHAIFVRSLQAFGYPPDEVKKSDLDPLALSRYSFVYWADHLCKSDPKSSVANAKDFRDGGIIDMFVR